MILAAASAVICVLLIERAHSERVWAHERRHLINSVIARHTGELAALNVDRPPSARAETRKATPERPGVNLSGQLVDENGQVLDETALIGLPGNN